MNQLDEIEKRLAAAVKGPWCIRSEWSDDLEINAPYEHSCGDPVCECLYQIATGKQKDYRTIEFIAHSRTDLEKTVKALRVAIDGLESAAGFGKSQEALEEIEKILEGEGKE